MDDSEQSSSDVNLKIVALAGGVGGAKLVDGLARVLPPGNLTVIVNTGDDFTHYGLSISPDLDTIMYTLGGVANGVNGWGLEGDTQQMLSMLRRYGDDPWFGLGDKDVATHLLRTNALHSGKRLSEVTAQLSTALGISTRIIPMTDDRLATVVDTVEHGTLAFQEYFVRYRWQPTVKALSYKGEDGALPAPGVVEAINSADAIIFCPSNPVLSVEPILRVKGIRSAIEHRTVPCIAVSSIIAGTAVKGPTVKIMHELGLDPTAKGLATYYGSLIDMLIVDTQDSQITISQQCRATDILMKTVEDRVRLAKEVLALIENSEGVLKKT